MMCNIISKISIISYRNHSEVYTGCKNTIKGITHKEQKPVTHELRLMAMPFEASPKQTNVVLGQESSALLC